MLYPAFSCKLKAILSDGFWLMHRNHSSSVSIRKTSLASSMPAVGGTKEMLPGTCRLF